MPRLGIAALCLALASSALTGHPAAAAPSDDLVLVDDGPDLTLMRADGTDASPIATSLDDAFVMDARPGRALIASGSGAHVLTLPGGALTDISPASGTVTSGSLRPGSQQVVLVVEDDDGEHVVLVTPGVGSTAFVAGELPFANVVVWGWSGDGTTLVLAGYDANGPATYLAREGQAPEKVATVERFRRAQSSGEIVTTEVAGTSRELVRYDATMSTRTVVRTFSSGFIGGISISRDGERIAVAAGPGLQQMTVDVIRRDGTLAFRYGDDRWERPGLAISAVELSPDGSALGLRHQVIGSGTAADYQNDGVYLVDAARGRRCQATNIYDHPTAQSIAWAPDGSYLLLGDYRRAATPYGTLVRGMWSTTAATYQVSAPRTPVAVTPCPPIRSSTRIAADWVNLKLGSRTLRATVGSDFVRCLSGITVRFQRRTSTGRWATKATRTTTVASGSGRASWTTQQKGRYRAVAVARVKEPFGCTGAVSNTRRW